MVFLKIIVLLSEQMFKKIASANKAVKPTHTASFALQWLRHFIAKLSKAVWSAYCGVM